MLNIKRIPKINLQLHNDFFGQGGEPDVANPILGEATEGTEATEGAEATEEVEGIEATEEGKEKATETIDTNKHKASPEDTTMSQPHREEALLDVQNKLDSIMSMMGTSNKEAEQVEEVVEGLSDEEIEKMNNEFYLKFTEKPLEALEELIEERANKKIEPIMNHFNEMQQVEQLTKVIDQFKTINPDFDEYIEEVTNLIQSDEGIRNSKNPLDLAYRFVKAERLETKIAEMEKASGKPLSESIKNKDTLKELLQDSEIKNLIVQELMLNKQDTPKVIGGSGKTTVTVADKPQSIEDGTKAWLNS